MGRRARHRSGEHTGPGDGLHAEPLAALSNARLPRVGEIGVLSGKRRLRFPRPTSGRDGTYAVETGNDARTSPARRRSAIRRRRCSTLVVAAVRPRRPHAHFRRPDMARLRRRTLCGNDRRPHGLGRTCSFSRRPGAAPRRARFLFPACDFG